MSKLQRISNRSAHGGSVSIKLSANRLRSVTELGQSIWLDYLDDELLSSGALEHMIRDDGVSGVTSNPAILEQALKSTQVAARLARWRSEGQSAEQVYESLSLHWVAAAANALKCTYQASQGRDGFVCIEVSPRFAHDADATVSEALRLTRKLALTNVMIKVPSTDAGVLAMRRLIASGIHVNATLLFSLSRYRQVSDAYLAGLEDRLASGESVKDVASVASFFVSRIDTAIDAILIRRIQSAASALEGRSAIACAALAYADYGLRVAMPRWHRLAEQGAQPQRLLWASTSTKNPSYSDVKYVEALIGPDTINTLPLETLNAYRDHGRPQVRLAGEVEEANRVVAELAAQDIQVEQIAAQLERDGLDKFAQAYARSIEQLQRTRLPE